LVGHGFKGLADSSTVNGAGALGARMKAGYFFADMSSGIDIATAP